MSAELLYPELSFKLVGLAMELFNKIGYGMPEKYYQKAYAELLTRESINYQKELYVNLSFEGLPLTKHFLDFKIEDKIVIEFKVRHRLGYVHIKQVTAYLKATGCELAILIYFTPEGIKYRRIINSAQKYGRN